MSADSSTGRPSDEEILAFSQSIQDEATRDVPLVSDPEPVSTIGHAYGDGSLRVREKIRHLATTAAATATTGDGFGWWCRTRGDGNCFYRAFATGLLADRSIGRDTLTAVLAGSSAVLDAGGFSPLVYEDFLDGFTRLVRRARTVESVLAAMNEPEESNSAVVLLRFLTSAYVKAHPEGYAGYLLDGEVLTDWCERWIEAMGSEADNLQINALVNALGVTVQVAHLDGTDTADGQANVVTVVPDAGGTSIGTVRVLYRPGHYDLLL
ncbi:putative Ubiquitin thiolesterase [Taphrina deformans PYCC 5710]|uniref:ubiquitinyl hydrolase 1 n=1 Tax=Taphrina deformans (strain PYCC 5710 / ATCC 11124 / CBS 356.35 / IMI 108563 / JCM 9778 / NBRC 8474) TaxID=1097556 RepID=R4XBU1_TAPDE|nr:putative Ubiquitin thiolesterase [Taphrina deformans PYCC 5710]|eukprot:CCG83040.1 putative Ubiquitin thiolesterase [Taphrina deformans PYCC 5710]